ncbi:MAG: amidohydrolase [Bacteroidota bacterium]
MSETAQPEAAAPPVDYVSLLSSIRRRLHRYPELGMQEVQTAKFIRNTLRSFGLEVHGPVAQTGLFVDIEGDHPGPLVGYRADIDALPIQELSETPYRSQHDGVAHLCGHDAHTAIVIGVALLLHERRARLHGTARVFFQPNEEGMPSGAPLMIADGVIDGMEAAYAIHVDPTLDVGQYGTIIGPVTAAVDQFEVTIDARSTGHSARPHQAHDTVWIATLMAQQAYQLIGRVTDARNPAVLTICRFNGSPAFNVIPAEVTFGGTIRTTDPDDRELIKTQLQALAEHLGMLYDVRIDVDFQGGAPAIQNDGRLIQHIERHIRQLFSADDIIRLRVPSMGSEDFAHYADRIPGVLLRVGTASSDATRYPLHDAHFDIDEACLFPTARLMAEVVLAHGAQQIVG